MENNLSFSENFGGIKVIATPTNENEKHIENMIFIVNINKKIRSYEVDKWVEEIVFNVSNLLNNDCEVFDLKVEKIESENGFNAIERG